MLVWVCLKVTQTALAYFVSREYATSTVFWYLLVSGVAGGLAGFALAALLSLAFSSALALNVDVWGAAGSIGQWIAAALSLLPAIFLAAVLFRGARNSIPAWRPLSAYWRPFYNGLRFKLDGTPSGPPAENSEEKPTKHQAGDQPQ